MRRPRPGRSPASSRSRSVPRRVERKREVMKRSQVVLIAGVAWTLIAVVLFLTVGTMSFLGLALLTVGGFVPPLVYRALSGGPAATIGAVPHHTETSGPGR